MSRPLVGLLIAMLATLVAAPSTALAAGNALSAASVSPISGKAGTVVTLGVTYDGTHPATSVSASVGALHVTLSRTSGTATAGRWTGVTIPPAGTWLVRFSAAVVQGNAPSLDGPTITILPGTSTTGDSPTRAVASLSPEPISDGTSANDGSGDGGSAPAPPPVTPQAVPATSPTASAAPPATTQQGPAASASAAPAVKPQAPLPSAAAVLPPMHTSHAPQDDSMRAGPASSAFDVVPSLREAGSGSPVPAAELPGEDAWALPTAMTLAVTLASLLAIAGVLMLVAGRRRQETAAAAVAQQAAPASEADDPIVAAMGIAPAIALRARRARRLRDSMDERAARGTGPAEIDEPLATPRQSRSIRERPRRAPKR